MIHAIHANPSRKTLAVLRTGRHISSTMVPSAKQPTANRQFLKEYWRTGDRAASHPQQQ
jgi:hypothetical protein